MSYLKWLNDREDLEYKFSSVGFQDLISFDIYNIDFEQYFSRVISKSNNAKIVDKSVVNEKIIALFGKKPDLMQLTNGHDLLNTLAKYFREKTNHKGLSDENIASSFRMTFTFECFQLTELYQKLIRWSSENNTELF